MNLKNLFFKMLQIIGFVEATSKYKNLPIERDLDKTKQFDEE
ncbi:hypothetical protein [Paraclostridium sordellii]|nr:hypothetical protein [Paeniclostridium sordellii]